MAFDWVTWIAEQRGCILPAPCGRGAGAHGNDLPCDCECIEDVVRAGYRRGVIDARAQAIAAINVQQNVGYAEGGGLALACEVVKDLPTPEPGAIKEQHRG